MGLFSTPSLWFLDNQTIVTSQVTGECKETAPSGISQCDPSHPLRMRVAVLDAATGKVAPTSEWTVASPTARIVTAHGGKFVMQAENQLTLYSSDLKPLKQLSLPAGSARGWIAHPSPTGESILFVAGDLEANSPALWIWVNTDGLQIVRSWRENMVGRGLAISDDNIATSTCSPPPRGCETSIKVKRLDTDWKTITRFKPFDAYDAYTPDPHFINDSMFLLFGSTGHPTSLFTVDGAFVFAENSYPERCSWGEMLPSAMGRRFAVSSCKMTGQWPFVEDMGYQVLENISLYDSPFWGKSYALNLGGVKARSFEQLALSPDGMLLASVNGSSINAFQLPPLN